MGKRVHLYTSMGEFDCVWVLHCKISFEKRNLPSIGEIINLCNTVGKSTPYKSLSRPTYHTYQKVMKCPTFQCESHTHTLRDYFLFEDFFLKFLSSTFLSTVTFKKETLLCPGTVQWLVETLKIFYIPCVSGFCAVVCGIF